MGNTVIKVENLSKAYQLGEFSTGTLSNDIHRWWALMRGKEDPFLKIGEANDRTTISESNVVWSLKDINFEIEQGDAVGIIGRNGAGKSTLLKLLSRVTSPTTGSIKVKGRIASLLEVGTGFHPELTGRENIFLNGAILGMRKKEITKKFDEIVAFSGVERYIDTPVKRYSSGMYVRLAFAVAAHLESEILIVDEVLAVGDAEFQKKCLGKMGDVSKGEGRTVLFVSHNMAAVEALCNNCLYLKNGEILFRGAKHKVIDKYLNSENKKSSQLIFEIPQGDEVSKIYYVKIINKDFGNMLFFSINDRIGIEISYEILKEGYNPLPNVHIYTLQEECIFVTACPNKQVYGKVGKYKSIVWIPSNLLNDGIYKVRVASTTMEKVMVHFDIIDALNFEIIESLNERENDFKGKIPGYIRPLLEWETNNSI